IQDKKVPAESLPAQQVAFLQSHHDPDIRATALKLLPNPTAKRDAVIEQFKPAITLNGDSAAGKRVYEQRCVSCHRLEGKGSAVGPDLVSVKNSGREKLLLSILDPSREVAPNYVAFVIETTDGDSIVGIIANDTPTSLT